MGCKLLRRAEVERALGRVELAAIVQVRHRPRSQPNSRIRLFMLTGRTDESPAEIERARALDPLSLIIRTRLGTMLQFAGRDREAIGAFRHALEIDSTFAHARVGLVLSYAMMGSFPGSPGAAAGCCSDADEL